MQRYSTDTIALMGTRLSIVLPGTGKNKAMEAALAEAQRLEHLLNRHNPQSPLAKLNAGQGCRDSELIGILKECMAHKQHSSGCFDVNVAGLMALWKIEHGSMNATTAPTSKYIAQELNRKQQQDIALLAAIENGHFPEGQSYSIDLGGYAKGYATDRMVKILKAQGIRDAFISFGESSITALGHHPAGKNWKVAVPAGRNHEEYPLHNESLSISGSFAPQENPPLYGHIVSPVCGQAITGHQRAIVKGPTATRAEVLSTALLACASPKKQKAIMANYADCKGKTSSP